MTAKVCQIALVGQNIEWILKGILLYNTNKLILISTNNPEFIEKIDEVKKRLLDEEFEKSPIEIENITIAGDDQIEFSKTLKKLIIQNYNEGYRIEINATAGLRVWQILGFFISLQLENIIDLYFIINKKTAEPIIFPILILSKTEQIFLNIISENNMSIEEIKQKYSEYKNKHVSLGLLSKYLGKLKDKGIIKEAKSKKKKYFMLTKLGKFYIIEPSIYI